MYEDCEPSLCGELLYGFFDAPPLLVEPSQRSGIAACPLPHFVKGELVTGELFVELAKALAWHVPHGPQLGPPVPPHALPCHTFA